VKMNDKKIQLEKLIEYGSEEAIIQNLKDAGCSKDVIECCISCLNNGRKEELLRRLESHRKGLLHKVHEGEKQIDCLDYLVYQIDRCDD
jgi:hypothetical protein